jgi:hypothetical protein
VGASSLTPVGLPTYVEEDQEAQGQDAPLQGQPRQAPEHGPRLTPRLVRRLFAFALVLPGATACGAVPVSNPIARPSVDGRSLGRPSPDVDPSSPTSTFGGHSSRLADFVAFTRGKHTGARIGFHSIPVLSDGRLVQPVESVGNPSFHGDSSGCIRARPDDASAIRDWLSVGAEVRVVS